jgi:D-serine dehydratase
MSTWLASEDLDESILDCEYKGIPLGARIRLSELGSQGWNVIRGDLTLPVTTLREAALSANIETMAAYAERYGALFAPHGKTTMAPQLFRRQLDAGAWAITAATPSQVAVMRKYGVPRILLANELVEPGPLRWVCEQLRLDADFDFYALVDDPQTVAHMDRVMDDCRPGRPMNVLLEVGIEGGRTGCRTAESALEVARAVKASRNLQLAGVETYEGVAARGSGPTDLAAVDALLERTRVLVSDIARNRLFARPDPVVSAGGSIYFDRVVHSLSDWSETGIEAKLVLRSGCYISHDSGRYHRLSPLDGRRAPEEVLELQDALDVWAVVLSRPEPGLIVLGAGRRDVPYDVELPHLRRAYLQDGSVLDLLDRGEVTALYDQHALVAIAPEVELQAGDLVALGVSHPCGAFEKSPLVPLIDDAGTVLGGVRTFF